MTFVICTSPVSGSLALATALQSHPRLSAAGEAPELNRDCNPDIWRAVLAEQDVAIINLKRADTVALTAALVAESGEPFSIEPAEMESYLVRWQREYYELDELIEQSGRPSIEIWYEDLLDDWDGQLRLIQQFLGIRRPRKLKGSIEPGQPRKLLANYRDLQQHFSDSPWAPLFEVQRKPKPKPKPLPRPQAPPVEDDNRIINGLWIGPTLGLMEQLTIKSFQSNGHEFHLWTYDQCDGIPPGTILRDASEIVPREEIFAYDNDTLAGSVAGYSDIWRFALLYELGGWYVDMDVCCLRPFDFKAPIVLRRQNWNGTPVANIIKLPARHPFAYATWEQTRRLVKRDNLDFILPMSVLGVQIAAHNLQDKLVSPEHFINVRIVDCRPGEYDAVWADQQERHVAYFADNRYRLSLIEKAYAVHWCNQHAGWVGHDKDNPLPNTIYAELLASF